MRKSRLHMATISSWSKGASSKFSERLWQRHLNTIWITWSQAPFTTTTAVWLSSVLCNMLIGSRLTSGRAFGWNFSRCGTVFALLVSSVSGARDQQIILQCSRFSHSITQAPGIGHWRLPRYQRWEVNAESYCFLRPAFVVRVLSLQNWEIFLRIAMRIAGLSIDPRMGWP